MEGGVVRGGAALPARTAAELVEYARSNPGRLNYASAGHRSSGHLAMAYFSSPAKLDMVHIPFKSSQDATTDLPAARSHALIVSNVGALPFVKDPRIRLRGATSQRRAGFLPAI